jgi:LmbE family N-acetylglucosaminyl deacetylase/GT2 family glycosyltransferase
VSTELPEALIVPFEPSDLRGERVLVLAPHPDDETFACGGSLAAHREHGDPVHVAILSSGEQGDWSRERSDAEIRMVREAEAGRALFELGVDRWEFWRLPDRLIVADGPLVERLHELILRIGPSLIYAPSPLDIHPDHRAVAHALRLAVGGWPGALRIAWYENTTPIPVDHLVDVTPWRERKFRAIRQYASQAEAPHDFEGAVDGFGKYRSLTLGPEVEATEGFRVADAQSLDGDRIWRWAALQEPPAPTGEPAVSVVLRTRDRPERLREALDSLVTQTMKDFEVVVVNDGGSDVALVLGEYHGLRIRQVRLERRAGRGAAANEGVGAARAALIAYLDDDDVLLPDHLELLRAALDNHGEFAVAYSDVDLARFHWNTEAGDYDLTSRSPDFSLDFDADRLLFENYIPNVAVMHRRTAWERVGGFDASMDLLEDWDFLLRLAGEVPFVHVPRRTAEYRLRDGSSISAQRPWGYPEYLRAREALFLRYRDRCTPEMEMRVFHSMSDAAETTRAEAAVLRHRVTRLEGELEHLRVELELRERAHGEVVALRERLAVVDAEAEQLRGALQARPAVNGGPPAVSHNGGVRTGARRVAGALRHPDRAARWTRTLAENPRAGLDRLLGRR